MITEFLKHEENINQREFKIWVTWVAPEGTESDAVQEGCWWDALQPLNIFMSAALEGQEFFRSGKA